MKTSPTETNTIPPPFELPWQKATLLIKVSALLISMFVTSQAFALEIISEGYLTPETISQAPASFGSYGGRYFIPDFARASLEPSAHKLWVMTPNGGPPSLFATNPNIAFLGGVFLPESGWGFNSGHFLTTGLFPSSTNGQIGEIYVYDSTGAATHLAEINGTRFLQPRIAPKGFGNYGGWVVIGSDDRIVGLSPGLTITTVATLLPATDAFGIAFAPAGFGSRSGQLFTSSPGNGSITSITPDGMVTPFVNISLAGGQTGLRQIEFSPPDFVPGYGPLLFVSVSGSSNGGGTLGDVLVLDSDGKVIKRLRTDLGLTKFDPRGMVFIDDRNLLICDSSDPIYLATPADFAPPSPTLANVSTRLSVETGDNVLIGGFIVTGAQPKRVILRAIGPSLTSVGVPGALANPTLELHDSSGLLASNDNWMDAPNRQEIIDTGVAPGNELESAILVTLPANNSAYTAIVRGANNGTGIGLVEVYDLDRVGNSKLANLSTRGLVQTGDNVMIGGLIAGPAGAPSGRMLVRAIGPSLADLGVPNPLQDPTLELHDSNGAIIAFNDDWKDTQRDAIEATGIPPTRDDESAILAPLSSSSYTAIVRGKNNATGVGLVEVYDLGSP